MPSFDELVPSAANGRFAGVHRPYRPSDVLRLRGSLRIQHTLAELGANRLWSLLQREPYVAALGAMSGNQAMQMVKAGLKAIYLSGWQVAADNNLAGAMYPDQSLYPSNSGPELCRRINRTLLRADQIEPAEGFYCLKPGTGVAHCIRRGLAFARYADLLWWETSRPDLAEAREFAEAIHREFPGKLLAFNCSPSFNWRANLDDAAIAGFQRELGAMGYKFHFVTLAEFPSVNHGMFELARGYQARGLTAYTELQRAEFASEARGYTATRHQREVGTGYFDLLYIAVSGAGACTTAMEGSTESTQFECSRHLAAVE